MEIYIHLYIQQLAFDTDLAAGVLANPAPLPTTQGRAPITVRSLKS